LDRTVTFQVSDGKGLSNTQLRTIEVTAVNDAPVLSNIEAAALAYRANRPATLITRSIKVSDVDNAELTGATVKIATGRQDGDELVFDGMGSIVVESWDPDTGTLTLSGTDTVANYQRALRAVKFRATATGARTVTFQVDDGELANNLSNVATRSINVTA
jgi:hypothetical protein